MTASIEVNVRVTHQPRPLPRPLPRELIGYLAHWDPILQRYLFVILEVQP